MTQNTRNMAFLLTIPSTSELHMHVLCNKHLILPYGIYPIAYKMPKYNIHVIKVYFSCERDKLFPVEY